MRRQELLQNGVHRNIEYLPDHLAQYRESNLAQARRLEFNPTTPKPPTMSDFHLMGSELSRYGVQLSPYA